MAIQRIEKTPAPDIEPTINPYTYAAELDVSSPAAVSLHDIIVSHHLTYRPIHMADRRAEVDAMYLLASLLPSGSRAVLKQLAQTAIDLCAADTSGVSILEETAGGKQVFRWRALAGELESYEGGETPQEWSPCGECLNAGKPMLYSYPARFFTYFQKLATPIVEGLVIPMQAVGRPIGTIWIVSSSEKHRFDAEDVRVMTSLGAFVTAAIRSERTPAAADDDLHADRDVVWRELIRRTAAGDPFALELLIEETRPFVFARALRVLSSPADAEEAVADVYLQVSRIAARYDESRQNVLAWLFNLARSRAIDRLRARTRYNQSLESVLSLDRHQPANPESDAVQGQMAARIRGAIAVLPAEEKRAIQLAYLDGYTMTEIADLLGHPLGSVKSRIRRGMLTLRLLLASQEKVAEARREQGAD